MHTCRLLGCVFVSVASYLLSVNMFCAHPPWTAAASSWRHLIVCDRCIVFGVVSWLVPSGIRSFVHPHCLDTLPLFKAPHCASAVPLTPCAGELVKLKAGNYIHPIVRYWVTYVLTDHKSKVCRGSCRLGRSAAGSAGVASDGLHPFFFLRVCMLCVSVALQ